MLREGGDDIIPRFFWFSWLVLQVEDAKEYVGLSPPLIGLFKHEQEEAQFKKSTIAHRFQKYDKDRILENILLSLKAS